MHEEIGEDGGTTVLEAEGGSPEDEVLRREFWEQLRRGLDGLPEEQREAVVLCDLEGMSYEEMADVMGVPIGTVRSRIFRGRRALQERLAAFHTTPPRAAAGRKA